MDHQQPLLNSNSSCHSPSNADGVLFQPINNNITSTTNSLSNATATLENIATTIVSPSSSPTTGANHHHNHRNTQSIVTQKSNQVSTVLLYNIPIVSLYIEGQERLCLAQISNTLLKQFSYNEIHNRRVALGITCVQCTPVQLEILRRAGAMPVSSRRCGMITRREAERLCKSFLGDNTPPRLPEDFAFNVQHKCSWGCRGSFLPSRYNSSRAKCIKCHYCGMFFSPNKFIFHSHRIGPGDKYVQPDAANFNSWRRHMMLVGQPPQEVIYAWEDVKAMFNGGTRKRLLTSNSSSPIPRVITSSPSSCSARTSSSNIKRDQSAEDCSSGNSDTLFNKTQKIQKSSNSVNVTAAAAVVGVTAVAVGSTVRPLNLHFQTSAAAGLTTESSYAVGADMHLIPAAALSRSFMMDYMWQHSHQATKNTYNQHYQLQPKVKSNNSAFTFPWINTALGATTSDEPNHNNLHSNINYTQSVNSRWPITTSTSDFGRNLSQIINSSAFKPVAQQQDGESNSDRKRRRSSIPQSSAKSSDGNIVMHPNSNPHSSQNDSCNSLFSSDEYEHDDTDDTPLISHKDDPKLYVTENSESLDDDILVDIETTEDEKAESFSTNTITSTCSHSSFLVDNSASPDETHNNNIENEKLAASDDDVIDVVHNDNDDTVLEFASLTPLAIGKRTKENEGIALNSGSTFISHTSTSRCDEDAGKFYNIDNSNTENVPPLSISPKSNSSSACSRSSDFLYMKNKSHYESDSGTIIKNISRSDISDDQKINLYTVVEKTAKNMRKRSCENLPQDESDKTNWRYSQDINMANVCKNSNGGSKGDDDNVEDSGSKCKKKAHDHNANEAQLFEALAQKYEFTNNNKVCNKNISTNSSNRISNNINTNNQEFLQIARLCMQRPTSVTYEQNLKVQPQQPNQHQLVRLPTFYYRQQQFLLSPVEQHHQKQIQQHQHNNITQQLPATQVYLHLQQQQSVQKSQSYFTNEISQFPSSHTSTHQIHPSNIVCIPECADANSAFMNLRQNNQENG
ncbi:SKI family transcriptional corepressor fussel [Cochliomyia hominivorax]